MDMNRALFLLLITLPLGVAMAEDDDVAFFEKHVRPLLATHCYECHSVESGKAKGGLLLDS
ncbi:MAG: hypothetical protein ACI9DF_004958, partial [Verrucomicrobiales bacterium]